MILLLDFCTLPWWLAWLLPALLGLLAGWAIWSKWKGIAADLEAKVKGLNSKVSGLEADLAACRKSRTELDSDLALTKGRMREIERDYNEAKASLAKAKSKGGGDSSSTKSKSSGGNTGTNLGSNLTSSGGSGSTTKGSSESGNTGGNNSGNTDSGKSSNSNASASNAGSNLASGFAAGGDTGNDASSNSGSGGSGVSPLTGSGASSSGASSSVYSNLKSDNLQVVEGIGPKMESILKENGVNSWSALAGKSTSEVQGILDKYGDKYKIIDPKTWVQQAGLAASGDWTGLVTLQKQLDTGRTNATGMTDSKVEKILIKKGLLKSFKQDDLKAVEGIGPAIEKLMHNAGVKTWRDMANSSTEKLKGILDDAGSRFKLADPGTWAKQAELAADGKFKELQEYQDILDGGK